MIKPQLYAQTNQPSLTRHQRAGHADQTSGNRTEFAQDPLSFSSGPITRLRAKRFKEALNGLVQENWVDSKKTKMGSNNNQGLVHVIKAIEKANACKFATSMVSIKGCVFVKFQGY